MIASPNKCKIIEILGIVHHVVNLKDIKTIKVKYTHHFKASDNSSFSNDTTIMCPECEKTLHIDMRASMNTNARCHCGSYVWAHDISYTQTCTLRGKDLIEMAEIEIKYNNGDIDYYNNITVESAKGLEDKFLNLK